MNTSHTTIGKYEYYVMTPSIDAAKKLAKILDTSIGYLLGENDEANLFKDPKMLQRFQDISVLPAKEKECLLTTVDHFIKSAKISANNKAPISGLYCCINHLIILHIKDVYTVHYKNHLDIQK